MAGRCQHRKRNGDRCKGRAGASSYCSFHDPAQAEAQARGRKQGGRSRSRKPTVLPADTPEAPLGSMADVVTFLGATVNRVLRGQVDAKVGNCLGLLCGQLVRALEKGDLEARMVALEEALRAKGGRP
jgi:hypothetical protein